MNKDRLPSILQKTRQNRGASRAVVFVLCTAVVLCMLLAALLAEKTYTYDRTDIVLHNPYCGFAPMADDENEVGDNTLVYVEVTWKEWEPEKGVYDTASLRQKYHLDRWQAEGKKIVLRFVCDLPGEEAHRDIPDWLYDVTKDGTDYTSTYGKGYSPDYTNEVLITEHAKAIQALGNYFDQEERTAYVELGSLGHWGEWHVDTTAGIAKFPSEATAARYVEPYLQAFTAAKLMMRRPFSFVSQYGMGLYNDMTGDEDDTNEWLDWIANGGTYEEPVSPYTLTAVHGYQTYTITEDIELMAIAAMQKERVGYVHEAVAYDEYPESLRVSARQLDRWIFGQVQCMRRYSGKLLSTFLKNHYEPCLDMGLIFTMPVIIVVFTIVFILWMCSVPAAASVVGRYFLRILLDLYLFMILMMSAAVLKNHSSWLELLPGILLFPIFVIIWLVLLPVNLFRRDMAWKPVEHNVCSKIEDMK